MTRTKNGLPGIYNASPITLPDGSGSALAVNASGQLIAASPSGASSNQVQGTAADNAAAVGSPVQVGAKYFSTPQTYADGDIATNPADINGNPIGVGAFMSVPFTTTTVQAVGVTDAGNYRWVSVHITSQGTSSTVTFQGSNDGTNWVNVVLMNASNTGTFLPASSQTGASRIDSGPLSYRYFRLNVTGISAGTTAGTIIFSANPAVPAPSLVTAQQSGTWNVGMSSSYPATATALTNSSGNVANASAVATLAGTSSKTTYITGFEITSGGATAASLVSVTVTGTISGTLTYTYGVPAGATASATPLIVELSTPIPASATNTAIAVTLPALGAGNTNATVVAHGYQL